MSELKLLNCPFCGGEVEIALAGNKGEQWFVTRGLGKNKCTCRVFMESNMFSADDFDTKAKERDKLIAKWNTRTPMANIVEKLEEEKKRLKGLKNDCIALSDSEIIAIEEKAYNFAINIVKQEINKEN